MSFRIPGFVRRFGTAAAKNVGTGSGQIPTNADLPDNTQIMHVREQQSANTSGGTFTSGAWRTRTLNTEVTNTIPDASLATNQVTLPAGTYDVFGSAPASQTDIHRARLYNTTDGADLILGTVEFIAGATVLVTHSFIMGRITLADTKVIELQHVCSSTKATTGFGIPANLDSKDEVYSELWITKVPT